MTGTQWWLRWLMVHILEYFVGSQVPLRNLGHRSLYNNNNNNNNYYPNYYQNLQGRRPAYQPNDYYALQRRPYAATGGQRSLNMVDYHNRLHGYTIAPIAAPYRPKVHNIVYSNRINNFPERRDQNAMSYWAEWSAWSKCSKHCDGGVKTRIRVCKRREHLNYVTSSTECVGYRRGYKACNTHVCLTKTQRQKKKNKEREKMCTEHSKQTHHGELYKWIPYMRAGLSECKLNCLAEGHRIFSSFGNVRDGSLCGQKDGYFCEGGYCKEMKHKRLNSKHLSHSLKNSSTDSQLSQRPVNYNRGGKQKWIYIRRAVQRKNDVTIGYNHILALPRGAVNITINEETPSANFFALKIGKLFILNSKWQSRRGKLFYAAGSIFKYILQRKGNVESIEKIIAPGPLSESVDLLVFYQRNVINITYEYSMAAQQNVNFNRYLTNASPRLSIQQPSRRQSLVRIPSRRQPLIQGVSHFPPQTVNRYQQRNLPPKRYQMNRGNNRPAPYRVHRVNRFPPQPRRYQQARLHNSHGRYQILVPKSNVRRPAPIIIHKWQIGGIKKCDAKCNGGEQEYTYRCFATKGESGKFVEDAKCQAVARPPMKKRACNQQQCPVKWITSSWSKCSKLCGRNNTQHRDAICKQFHTDGKSSMKITVNDSLCAEVNKPKLVRMCKYVPCKVNWKVSDWHKCSATCDYGIQRRRVYCENSHRTVISTENCDKADDKPDDSRKCLLGYCSTSWFISEWGMCETACGESTQSRSVICRSSTGTILADSFCNSKDKPTEQRRCTGTACKRGFWVMTPWSKCSPECGHGKQYRKVFCAESNGNMFVEVSDKECPPRKPQEEKRCQNKICRPRWYATDWTSCPATCGRGIQRRQRVCMTDSGKIERGCYYKSRPRLMKFCNRPACVIKSNIVESTSATQEGKTNDILVRLPLEVRKKYLLHPPSLSSQTEVGTKHSGKAKATSVKASSFKGDSKGVDEHQLKAAADATVIVERVSLQELRRNPKSLRVKEEKETIAVPKHQSKQLVSRNQNKNQNVPRKLQSNVAIQKTKIPATAAAPMKMHHRAMPNNSKMQPKGKGATRPLSHTEEKTTIHTTARTIIATRRKTVTIEATIKRQDSTLKKSTTPRKTITNSFSRSGSRFFSRRRLVAKKKTSFTSSNSSHSVISKTKCFDRHSKAYCTVIAVRLKFCSQAKFRRLCCKSCRGR